jgi:hypothetical protein
MLMTLRNGWSVLIKNFGYPDMLVFFSDSPINKYLKNRMKISVFHITGKNYY